MRPPDGDPITVVVFDGKLISALRPDAPTFVPQQPSSSGAVVAVSTDPPTSKTTKRTTKSSSTGNGRRSSKQKKKNHVVNNRNHNNINPTYHNDVDQSGSHNSITINDGSKEKLISHNNNNNNYNSDEPESDNPNDNNNHNSRPRPRRIRRPGPTVSNKDGLVDGRDYDCDTHDGVLIDDTHDGVLINDNHIHNVKEEKKKSHHHHHQNRRRSRQPDERTGRSQHRDVIDKNIINHNDDLNVVMTAQEMNGDYEITRQQLPSLVEFPLLPSQQHIVVVDDSNVTTSSPSSSSVESNLNYHSQQQQQQQRKQSLWDSNSSAIRSIRLHPTTTTIVRNERDDEEEKTTSLSDNNRSSTTNGPWTYGGLDKLTTTTLSSMKNNTKTTMSSRWNNRPRRQLLSEFAAWDDHEIEKKNKGVGTDTDSQEEQQPDEDDDDDSSSSSPNIVGHNGWNTGGGKDNENDDKNKILATTTPTRQPRHKVVVNIDRLRDRWWDVLERKNRQRALIEELKRTVEHRCPQQHDNEEDDGVHCEEIRTINRRQENNMTTIMTVRGTVNTPNSPMRSSHEDIIHSDDPSENDANTALGRLLERSNEWSTSFDLVDHIVANNDSEALRAYLTRDRNTGQVTSSSLLATDPTIVSGDDGSHKGIIEYALTATINHTKPHLLHIIVSSIGGIDVGMFASQRNPLMQAAELGHEECLSVLLTNHRRGADGLLALKDQNGDNVFHYCCRGEGNESTLRLLFKVVAGSAKGKQQHLSKLVLTRNEQLRTPLHVASKAGRVDFVEVFLTSCSSFLLSRLLAMEDKERQTPLLAAVANNSSDVVMSLIMWRGNYTYARAPTKAPVYNSVDSIGAIEHSSQNNKGQPEISSCPLVLAARGGNLEMIELLLQFGDQFGRPYDLIEALSALLQSGVVPDVIVEGCECIIYAGGNPFKERVDRNSSRDTSSRCESISTAVALAANLGSDRILHSVISTGVRTIRGLQLARRRDPKLAPQPDAFFRNLEAKENLEMKNALKGALIDVLLLGHNKQSLEVLSRAVVLYEHGTELEEKDVKLLQDRINSGENSATALFSPGKSFVATYQHSTGDVVGKIGINLMKDVEYDRSNLEYWSRCLLTMPWMIQDVAESKCTCPWIHEHSPHITQCQPDSCLPGDGVYLVTSDGAKFLVSSSIVSQKSDKLASAIRFAKMNQDESKMGDDIEVFVTVPSEICKLLIQHIYHGSIVCNWPNVEDDDLCRFLLELMLVAEEYLCQSLIKECEMRLLNSDPKRCFCFSCCRAVRAHPSNDGGGVVECLYLVDGCSSLVKGSTALDVLSVTEYMDGGSYSIKFVNSTLRATQCMSSARLWADYDKETAEPTRKEDWIAFTALASLNDFVIVTMLKEFSEVAKSGAYQQSAKMNEGLNGKCGLLQLCLDELRANAMLAAAYPTFEGSSDSSRSSCTNIRR